ncbi:hypothetical protein VII_000109 [Vibrio mimicus MB451]|nr:hypothetical protein VII_000109 [Vibrio mimicus MB451]
MVMESSQQIDHFPQHFALELTRYFLVIASFCWPFVNDDGQ